MQAEKSQIRGLVQGRARHGSYVCPAQAGRSCQQSDVPRYVLSIIVEQLVALYLADEHRMAAALVHTAQDVARLAQGSKALHTTAMAMWHLLASSVDARMPFLPRKARPWDRPCEPLPTVVNVCWVGPDQVLH